MTKHINLQKDYTLTSLYYQIKLPLELEVLISSDDPVRLLSAFVEGMELSDLYKTYGKIKSDQASPRHLLNHATFARFLSLPLISLDSSKMLLRFKQRLPPLYAE